MSPPWTGADDHHEPIPDPGIARRPPAGRATPRDARRFQGRRHRGRDQGLRPAGPGSRRHDAGSGRRGRRLHPEHVRGRARAPVAGAISRPRPAIRAAGSAGPRRSSRRAAPPMPRPATRATPTSATSGSMSPRSTGKPAALTLHLSTGVIGTRLPLDKVAAGLERLAPTLSSDRRRPGRDGRGAPDDRFGDEARDDDRRAARCRRPARDGDRERDREGRRDDPSEHGHDALGGPDRRGHRAEPRSGRCCGPRRHGPGTSSRSMATRARTTRSSSWHRAPRRPRRSTGRATRPMPWARPSRRWPATSRDSRPPTARGPRRSSRPR